MLDYAGGAGLGGQLRRHRAAPVDVDDASTPHQPTWAMIDIDPGPKTTLRRRARARPPAPHRARPPRRAGACRRSPASGASRSGCRSPSATRSTRPGTGSRRCRGRSAQPCPSSSAGSGRSPKRHGLARLDYTQNAINKTLVAPFSARPRPARRCRCRSPGTSSTTPTSPDRWTIRTIGERLAEAGDPLAPLIGLQQRLPTL